jgi:hypothetical protein
MNDNRSPVRAIRVSATNTDSGPTRIDWNGVVDSTWRYSRVAASSHAVRPRSVHVSRTCGAMLGALFQ